MKIDLTPNQIFTGAALSFEVKITARNGVEFEASITDDARLRVRHTECIEPAEWSEIASTLMTAVEQARDFAGEDWSLDVVDLDLQSVLAVVMKSGTRQLADDLPEEGEPKALRVNYRIMDGERVMQTGMVDWQSGLYIWDAAPIDFAEFPAVARAISAVCEKCREIMVEHREWQ